MGVTTDERPPLSNTKVIFGGCCNNADKMSKIWDGTKDIGLIIPIPFYFSVAIVTVFMQLRELLDRIITTPDRITLF